MKSIGLFFLALHCMAAAAQTPITLSNTNMPGSGDTLRYTNVQLSSVGNYTQTGANVTWNFTNVVSTTQGLREFKSALLTPYALYFLSLNEYGEKIADSLGVGPVIATNYYNFYKKSTTPNAFIADGAGITFSSIPIPSYYSDKDELYNFPMSYPKYDSTTFRFATPATTLIPVRYSKTGYRVTTVDGWGTVTTPYGTQSCLRLITTQYSMDSVNVTLGSVSIPFGLPNNVRSYQWLTTGSKIPFMEVTGSLAGGLFTPTQARYRGYPLQGVGIVTQEAPEDLQLYPNPVSNILWLQAAGAGPLAAEIYDVQGRPVHKAKFAAGVAPCGIDLSALEPGVYTIKVEFGGNRGYRKFIKE